MSCAIGRWRQRDVNMPGPLGCRGLNCGRTHTLKVISYKFGGDGDLKRRQIPRIGPFMPSFQTFVQL